MFFKNSLQRLKWEAWEVCLNIASSTLCRDGEERHIGGRGMQLRAEWISFLFKVIETQWRERLPLFPPLIICIDGSPVSPSACPLPVNDSLHFTLQEPRKTLWPFPVKSEEIDRAREKRCDRAVWLGGSWLSWCGEELAQDKHVRKTKRHYFSRVS